MTHQLTQAQEKLANYLISHNFNNLSNEQVQELIQGMSAQAITEVLEYAKTHINQLKSTSLGRELL